MELESEEQRKYNEKCIEGKKSKKRIAAKQEGRNQKEQGRCKESKKERKKVREMKKN